MLLQVKKREMKMRKDEHKMKMKKKFHFADYKYTVCTLCKISSLTNNVIQDANSSNENTLNKNLEMSITIEQNEGARESAKNCSKRCST